LDDRWASAVKATCQGVGQFPGPFRFPDCLDVTILMPVKQLRTMKPTRFRLDTHSGSKTATTARLTSMSERSRFQLAVFGTAINLGTLSPFN
jgi:hypothetical protein